MVGVHGRIPVTKSKKRKRMGRVHNPFQEYTLNDLRISHKAPPPRGSQHLPIVPPWEPNLSHMDLWRSFSIQTVTPAKLIYSVGRQYFKFLILYQIFYFGSDFHS
jgi:hypothetical protein